MATRYPGETCNALPRRQDSILLIPGPGFGVDADFGNLREGLAEAELQVFCDVVSSGHGQAGFHRAVEADEDVFSHLVSLNRVAIEQAGRVARDLEQLELHRGLGEPRLVSGLDSVRERLNVDVDFVYFLDLAPNLLFEV